MAHPDWALKYKEKNTELRCIKGRYYLYAYSTIYCPIKKRAKKVTGKSLGRITEKDGFIPSGTKIPNDFMRVFSALDDPRSPRAKTYPLVEILIVAFLSIISGGEGYVDMECFGKLKLMFLRKFYAFKNGTPSDDTFRRFFTQLNPDTFKILFRKWVESLAVTAQAMVIAIDGKCSRGSHDGELQMLHTVSAYDTGSHVVFGQEKVDSKSNEITAIPALLDVMDIKNAVITIDAMGCQFLIADIIVNKGADYVLSLKGNQGSLQEDVKLFLDNSTTLETFTHCDAGHGRIEQRTISLAQDVAWLKPRHEKWNTIQTLIKIESTREIKDKKTTETRYYISSKRTSPQAFLNIIRSHWAVENSLHWVLDMTFHEDKSRIRKGHAPLIMTMMRHAALNLLQLHKTSRQSIKNLMRMSTLDDQILFNILTRNKPS